MYWYIKFIQYNLPAVPHCTRCQCQVSVHQPDTADQGPGSAGAGSGLALVVRRVEGITCVRANHSGTFVLVAVVSEMERLDNCICSHLPGVVWTVREKGFITKALNLSHSHWKTKFYISHLIHRHVGGYKSKWWPDCRSFHLMIRMAMILRMIL